MRTLLRRVEADPVKYLVPVFLACGTALHLRDEWWVNWVLGGCASAVVVKVLKAVVNERRPDGATKRDAGFPSSHAFTMTYLAMYVVLRHDWTVEASPVGVLLLVATLATGADRVRRREHTVAQVVAGFASGGLFSVAHNRVLVDGGGAAAMQRVLNEASPSTTMSVLAVLATVTVSAVKVFRRFHVDGPGSATDAGTTS